ncbi:MAG: Hydroxymethylpyrimidine phosphate kinase ThiD [uncultured Pyrinomonadaceae bacterium]|uniref:hydroxymethylpyrimidine kinase n=1 Tax=uncultured Pyrinomonadaceae bacterium TaxID=2283094 RepID=A0A6J4NIQ9_9BACT|nr:MAG: Hydroxymethylpyrimidine phosphate kinase ThiD [uncultured Pyrinomonadaceae bacterium]
MNTEREDKSQVRNSKSQICLTVAGLDPSGGAGIIADIKTFSAFGCFATAAVSSLTFQNTTGVFGAIHQTAESIRGQIKPIVEDYALAATKTGMLPNREVIEETARLVAEYSLKNFVVDPVVRSTSGFDLIDEAALKVLIERLFPLADLITPNLPEAERIAQMKIESEADVEKAAKIMRGFGAKNVLIKGGHLSISDSGFRISDLEKDIHAEEPRAKTDARIAKDYLFVGDELHVYEAEFIETNATHGTGCTLAAAITANLALGKTLFEAVGTAKEFVTEAIRTAPNLGRGHSPINTLPHRPQAKIS